MTDTRKWSHEFDAVVQLEAELRTESPRGGILLSAAMLEDALRELLIAFLVPIPSASDTLFDGPTAPFGSFSAKIDGAYRMGLVSHRFCRDLHIIRRLRNVVAHKPHGFRFEDQGAREQIAALSKSHGIFDRSPKWIAQNGQPSFQAQFFEAAAWMLYSLAAERKRITGLNTRDLEFGYEFSRDALINPGAA